MAAYGEGQQQRLLLLCAAGFWLLVGGAAAIQDRAEPGPGTCHADCTKFGNCGENGQCRCPFGRLGEACEIDFLAPCKPSKDGIPNCGTAITKSCECMRRCQQFFCRSDFGGTELCERAQDVREMNERGCYEREGVPPDEQYSAIPEADEPGVTCFAGYQPGSELLGCSEALVRGGDKRNLPMLLCPGQKNCSNRGYCERPEGNAEGRPVCRCNRGYTGDMCEIETNGVCYRGCSGRGKCIDQFCHCEPPYFSIGCTRSKVYSANYSRPNPLNFKVFMYELPTSMAYDSAPFVGFVNHNPIYTASQKFLEHFLVSPVRTEDPSEAHLFFIPSFTFSYSGNVGLGEEHLHLLLQHIQQEHPHWNRTGGRDHFFWAPADRGACFNFTNPLSSLLFDPIRVVHFGYHTTPESRGPLGDLGHPGKMYS